jgi:hypothetical protein
MKKNEDQVVYPITFAKEFPEPLDPEVDRGNLIQTIDRLFGETHVVFLDSEEGSGTSTICAQFCRFHQETAVALFVKSASRIVYSADYLRLVLAEQFHWLVEGTKLPKEIISPEEFNVIRLRLRARASKARPLYIVVDGLHQIPEDDERAVEAVLREILPIGWDHFRFLIVGKQDKLGRFLGKTSSKQYYPTSFSFSEVKEFFARERLNDEELHSIHSMCSGMPGKMAAVRRLLRAGTSVDGLLNADPSQALEFVQLEFAPIDDLSEAQLSILATLTFSSRHLAKSELLEIAGASTQDLDAVLNRCTFLVSTALDVIEFVSDAHRRYASKRLEDQRHKSLKAQIEYLVRNPSGTLVWRVINNAT